MQKEMVERKSTRTCAECSDEFEVGQFEIAHRWQWLHYAAAMRHVGLSIRDAIAGRLGNRRRRHGVGPVCGLSSALWSTANSLHPQACHRSCEYKTLFLARPGD